MKDLKLSNKPADFIHPSPYEVWRKYVHWTSLQNRIGPWKFALFLHEHRAIELFYFREKRERNLKCKLLNTSKIPALLESLKTSPWLSPLSWVSQLARRPHTKGSRQSRPSHTA
jgi:hypothetical protein